MFSSNVWYQVKYLLTCISNVLHLILKNLGQVVSTKKKEINRVQQNNFKRYLSFGMNGVKLY